MPIEMYTGLPGNGKTAMMMQRLNAEAAKAERPLFAGGIDGLAPGLATVLSDPRDWNAEDPNGDPTCDCHQDGRKHAHVIPNGALIFIDEAWKWFGHLHDASRQATPGHVLKLAEHRHRGIDFIWTTQQPNQIYPFARGLIATHNHVVRRFGTQLIEVYTWQELNEDVKSASKRALALKTTKALPKEVFGMYKSADVHTIKRRIPARVFALPLLLVAAVGLAWLAFNMLRPESVADRTAAGGAQAAPADAPASPSSGGADDKRGGWANVDAYVEAHTARIPTLPWSAPVFDGRGVTADPMVYCMLSGAGQDADGTHREASCTCTTEQGTKYALDTKSCGMVARQGPSYNPYRERSDERMADPQRDQQQPVAQQGTAAGAAIAADQVTGYGDLGQRNTVAAGI